MSIYVLAISGGNSLGPLICGFITETIGWRWQKWTAAIFTGVTFLVVVIFLPETRYDRDYSASLATKHDDASMEWKEADGDSTSRPKPSLQAKAKAEAEAEADADAATSEARPQLPRKSYLSQISLFSGLPPSTSLLTLFLRPFPLIVHPAVLYSFLAYAISLVLVVAINILNPFALQAPPYNFSTAIDGLINIPGLLGNLVGAVAGGLCVDYWCDFRARRNDGFFVPETRLTLLIVPLLLAPAGSLLFGYGIAETLSWPTPFIGYGMVSIGLTAAPTITMAYVSDVMLPVAPDALLLVNGLKNIVAFGFLYGCVPWAMSSGYVDVFGAMAGIYVGIVGALGLPLWIWGDKIRHVAAGWRVIWAR